VFPSVYFSLFPSFPTTNRVFVAMSFNELFGRRWRNVIEPAISAAGLEPFRVDASLLSDSIVTEILREISTARLVFADVTAIQAGIRNGNVMYEIGIAHAVRLPEEVVLFRSDHDPLLFDVSGIRVHEYTPERDEAVAREQVTSVVRDVSRAVDLSRHLAVERICDSLNAPALSEITLAMTHGGVGEAALSEDLRRQAVQRLLDMGVFRLHYPDVRQLSIGDLNRPPGEFYRYELTPLGEAVFAAFKRRLRFDDMSVERLLTWLAHQETRAAAGRPSSDDPDPPAA
jgi:hypothetical protein